MKDAEILERYTRDQVKEAYDKLDARLTVLEKTVKDSFRRIMTRHLEKRDLIGEGEKCKFKTLMEFTLAQKEQNTKDMFDFKE